MTEVNAPCKNQRNDEVQNLSAPNTLLAS